MGDAGRTQPLFTIGEFSRITGITVKALRLYHEQELLAPAVVDQRTGYRYYHEEQIEAARAIVFLRDLEFQLGDIRRIVHSTDEAHVLEALEQQKAGIDGRIRQLRKASRSLERFLQDERLAAAARDASEPAVVEKDVPRMLIAGIRMRGHYSACGAAFARIGRSMGRFICGKPFLLLYDTEYREADADFQACMPVRPQAKHGEGIQLDELAGFRCATLIHVGPYDRSAAAYARVLRHARERNLFIIPPTREVYLKGPGMIFRGDPRRYVTEIQIPIDGRPSAPTVPSGSPA